MNIWGKLFGGAKHSPVPPPLKPPHATLSQPKITQEQSSSSAGAVEPALGVTKLQGLEYFNKEWNFGITIPSGWEIVFENENEDGNLWMQPLRIVGPKASRGRPFLSVLVMPAKEDGKGLQGYMDNAEEDLRGHFDNFALDTKRETSLLGFPVAWMTYSYRIDSGPRKEINATSFFGSGGLLLFQFICETDLERAAADFPTFEGIIKSLHVGSAGIRHPNITIAGSTECSLCHATLSEDKCHTVMHLKLSRLIPVCDSCFSIDQSTSSQPAAIADKVKQKLAEDCPKHPIVRDEFTFDNVQELFHALEKKLLPNVERAIADGHRVVSHTGSNKGRDCI